MNKLKGFFQNNVINMETGQSATAIYQSKVPIHPLTQHPTKVWEKLKVKQKVEKIKPVDPNSPIREDCLRFVCLSDTHSAVETLPDFVPTGDVLLHAGDFTQIGLPMAIKKFDDFLGQQKHKAKIVIAGNHDMTLDLDMVTHSRAELRNRFGISVSQFEDVLKELKVNSSRELLRNCVYLEDSSVRVCGINIYGSPWQPEFGGWGFNLERGEQCCQKWDQIPDTTDILVTHGPPVGYGDLCFSQLRAGCVELLTTIQTRVRPKFHIFGHIHEAYGVFSDGQTTFINASNCTLRYKPQQLPIVFDFPIPEGHSKQELEAFPQNNIQCLNSGVNIEKKSEESCNIENIN